MELYQSEEEQVEAIKKWGKENGRTVIAGIIIGIAAVGGWKMWQNYEQTRTLQASSVYQEVLNALGKKNSETALQLIERLINEHTGTSYATYARFFKAKLKVENGDLDTAKSALEDVLKTSNDENYKHVARLRLGKVLLAKSDPQTTLNLLSNAASQDTGKFEAGYHELIGDAYLALKRPDDARAAYLKARELDENSQFLQLKIDDLAAPPVVPVPVDQTAQ